MVHLTCDCLNIRIHAKSTCATSIMSPNQEVGDAFFQDGAVVAVNVDLAGVTKEVPCLVKTRSVGDWKVHNCVNCHKDVYASDSSGENILVSTNLKTDATELNTMIQSEPYSPLYKIIIYPKQQPKIKKNLTLDLHTHRSEALDKTLNSLQQQLTRFLQSEQDALEERIKSYAEQQRTLFAALQNRVRQDKQAIASLLMESEEHDLESALSEAMIDSTPGLTPPMTPVGNTNQSSSPDGGGKFRDQLNSEEQDQVISEIPKQMLVRQRPQSFNRPFNSKLRRKGVYNPPKITQSLDTDGIFDLDGVEEEVSPFFQCDDDLDSAIDDTSNDDDVFDNKDVFSSGQMSLPISMPVWTQNRHMELTSDEDDDKTQIPNDPEQIAASIKAMARSVHQSDTTEMFGDLPRPRLNTMN